MEFCTERLILREFTDDDFAAVHRYTSNPDAMKFMLWGPNSEEETRGFLAKVAALAAEEPRTGYELAVTRRDDGALLGGGCLYVTGTNGEIGYCLSPDAWNRGYATEAARELMRYGFEEHRLHRIFATCRPANAGSARVIEKLGMQREGHLREYLYAKGRYHDSLLFSILEEEWRAGQ
ncbi:GNAT family N-acetyltransferase [Gorillibacterium timonense]|uniref:GNAT family N-acetyltransferase n=1 Tax=Gorillibacterium timonense TaxID=1689269 RepID=UPI00071E04C6|nr:GNAT family protein [Gorillibacterium timonense]